MGISREQALDCFRSDDLVGIGMEADAVRRRLHPEGVVSYVLLRSIEVDEAVLLPGDSLASVYAEIGEAVDMGGTGVRILSGNGGADGTEQLNGLERLFRGVRQRFASLWIEGFTAAEVAALARAW